MDIIPLKSGFFFIFQDSTRCDKIIAEHQIVHTVPPVLHFSVWYSIKRASRDRGRIGCVGSIFLEISLFFAYGSANPAFSHNASPLMILRKTAACLNVGKVPQKVIDFYFAE